LFSEDHNLPLVSDNVLTWQCGPFSLVLDEPVIMGILNVTPDSFSDGGAHDTPAQAINFAQQMIDEGARIIDVGGESTRPGSDEVSPEVECARVLPVVKALVERRMIVSVDTRHAEVARACVEVGAAIINDVTGFRESAMRQVVRDSNAGLVVMHMAGEPKSMQNHIHYDDVVAEVATYLMGQVSMLEDLDIDRKRICIDPGPGFGKTSAHTIRLLAHTSEFAALGYPVLAAYSRKNFIGQITGEDIPAQRASGSVAAALMALMQGAHIFRVHDVKATHEAFEIWKAVRDAR